MRWPGPKTFQPMAVLNPHKEDKRQYRRAQLSILDPEALENGACECLHLIESLFQPKRHSTTAQDYSSA
jgi:hypothetical protein